MVLTESEPDEEKVPVDPIQQWAHDPQSFRAQTAVVDEEFVNELHGEHDRAEDSEPDGKYRFDWTKAEGHKTYVSHVARAVERSNSLQNEQHGQQDLDPWIKKHPETQSATISNLKTDSAGKSQLTKLGVLWPHLGQERPQVEEPSESAEGGHVLFNLSRES